MSVSARPKAPAAFEFRHPSWLDDEVNARLAARNFALCVADSEKLSTPVTVTVTHRTHHEPGWLVCRKHRASPQEVKWVVAVAQPTPCTQTF